jgi:predicted small secreted protein
MPLTTLPDLRGALTLLLLALALTLGACETASPVGEDRLDLQQSVQTFHKNLRWSRYEIASEQLTPAFKQRFLGRYEEMGEDMHFVHIEVLQIERVVEEEESLANVEVLQKWYREPDMTVKTDKIIEIWRRDDIGWRLTDRVEKKEWRERQRAKRDANTAADEPAADTVTPPPVSPPAP